MKIVYVVVINTDDGGWYLSEIVGIFSTKEKAINCVKKDPCHVGSYGEDQWYEIKEYYIDPKTIGEEDL